jgi:hypothetical protein
MRSITLKQRDGEYSRGPTFGDFVTILTEGSMQNNKVARLYRVQEYRLFSPHSSKCNVLLKNLSENSQNIPYATLKRRGFWLISVYLCIKGTESPDAFLKACKIKSVFYVPAQLVFLGFKDFACFYENPY